MNKVTLAIARREASLYLHSPALWLGMGIMLAVVLGTQMVSPVGPLEHFLSGEALGVYLTAFIAILVMSAGLARETRDSFDDVWNSLPVRNYEQFFGKTLGASAVVLVLGLALLLVIPVGWFLVGTTWTRATTSAVLASCAQTVAVLGLSVGIATFLRSVIGHLRVRYVVGLGIVVASSIAQALGIDSDSLWAVLLSPYVFASLPYSHSSLFGMFPWFPAVVWHIVFQVLVSLALIFYGSLLYQRRRDPASNRTGLGLVLGVLVIGMIMSVIQYQRFWNDIDDAFQVHLAVDHLPARPFIQLETGQWMYGEHSIPVQIMAYDLDVNWLPGLKLEVTAVLDVEGEPDLNTWPFTLHHQWTVETVSGHGVVGWTRQDNVIRLEMEPGTSATQITVQYSGQPFLWHRPIGTISPMHFVSDEGGYLSPLLAWYPLPGERGLVRRIARGFGDRVSRYWTEPVDDLPLIAAPVPMELRLHHPGKFQVMSNLSPGERIVQSDRTTEVFSGRSDGISLLIGPMVRAANGPVQTWGAASVVQPSDALGAAYHELLSFYDTLIGRDVPRDAVVAVPSWLRRFFNTYRMVTIYGLTGSASSRMNETVPMLGTTPVVTEQALDRARRAAERWAMTGDPLVLFQGTESIHSALLQSIWGRPHAHLPYTKQPVALGLAEYSLIRWEKHVLGPVDIEQVRSNVISRPKLRTNDLLDTADRVLLVLMELEEFAGTDVVAEVLGVIYDQLQTQPVDFARFEAIVEQARAGVRT